MSKDPPRIYIVIPTHNRLRYTIACIESIRRQTWRGFTIVIADGGSTDGTAATIRDRYSDVVVLEGLNDWWWTAATNAGIRWSLERSKNPDYILTLNDDTTIEPDYLETLVRFREEHENALVSSVTVDSRDPDIVADGGPRMAWASAKNWSQNSGCSLTALRKNGVQLVEPDLLPGRGTLIPMKCLREIGIFDEARFPQYAADYEFSARAQRAGYDLLMQYESPVISVVDATAPSPKRSRLSWATFLKSFVSRRSPTCLLYRWRFAMAAAPKGLRMRYAVLDTLRVLGGGLRDQLKNVRG